MMEFVRVSRIIDGGNKIAKIPACGKRGLSGRHHDTAHIRMDRQLSDGGIQLNDQVIRHHIERRTGYVEQKSRDAFAIDVERKMSAHQFTPAR
jgi:hypothetical protein